nr:glycosyl hydrolase family 79 C-terminal domain-containing protein [Mucilaginibacter sp. JRF]
MIVKNLLVALMIVPAMVSCKKNSDLNGVDMDTEIKEPTPVALHPTATGAPVTITVDQSQPGNQIPANFLGLSYETNNLLWSTNLSGSNTTQVQLIRNLGEGVLRVGGTSSGKVYWTNKATAKNSKVDSLTTTQIDGLANFSKALGWPVIYGLNMANYNPASQAKLAKYLSDKLGDNLMALQAGNEPNAYPELGYRKEGYSVGDYKSEWKGYYEAVRKVAPEVTFAGPDVVNAADWVSSFGAQFKNNVKFMTVHYYNNGPATDESITYKTILEPDTKLAKYLDKVDEASAKNGLKYRVSECNSIFNNGGKAGVSDVFASSLWALDMMWTVAEHNGQGVNFHSGSSQAFTAIATQNGKTTARPVYYGMLAFKYAGNGRVLPVKASANGVNQSAHASVKNGATSVTLINKDDKDILYTVKLSSTASKVTVARLTAPSATATDNIAFGGASVDEKGNFNVTATETFNVNQKSFTIQVPAYSAAVITIN